jgi:hypothetical protein
MAKAETRLISDYRKVKVAMKNDILDVLAYLNSIEDEDTEAQAAAIKSARQALNKIDRHFNRLIARVQPKIVLKSFTEN